VRNHDAEGQPVKIGLLQRYAIDNMKFEEHPFKRAASTGKKIAVVGAGPAGLSCAHRLAMLGNDVVIYEAKEKSGGLNEYGIAKYKLTDNFAQKEVDFLLQIGGITIKHGQTLGGNVQLKDLHAQYDAVFLGLGLGASKQLGLTGEDAPGLLAAVDYIAALRQSDDLSKLPVPSRAIVIGAGNTAIDMAVQIQRLGAEEVTLVYRRGFEAMSATEHEQHIAKRIRSACAPGPSRSKCCWTMQAACAACALRKRHGERPPVRHRRDLRDCGRRHLQGHRPEHGRNEHQRSAGENAETRR
jgi:glutamate synthase (NADPH/NADH) small chain